MPSTTLSPTNAVSYQNSGKETISISTGYLNLKDVFYHRSVTELPEYVGNKERFRSISSLHSQKDGSISVHSPPGNKTNVKTRSETVAIHKIKHVLDSGGYYFFCKNYLLYYFSEFYNFTIICWFTI